MKFSGKMSFEIILKVTKNQGFTLSLEDTFFKKPHEGLIWPPRHIRVNEQEHHEQNISRKISPPQFSMLFAHVDDG